jgi:predicted enzyme related to lactoylglutathione lyase
MLDANDRHVKHADRGGACIWSRVKKVETSFETIEKDGRQLVSRFFDDERHGRFHYFKDPDGNIAVIY